MFLALRLLAGPTSVECRFGKQWLLRAVSMPCAVTSQYLGEGQVSFPRAVFVLGDSFRLCFLLVTCLWLVCVCPICDQMPPHFPLSPIPPPSKYQVKKFAAGSRQLLQTINVKAVAQEAKNPYTLKVSQDRCLGLEGHFVFVGANSAQTAETEAIVASKRAAKDLCQLHLIWQLSCTWREGGSTEYW